MSTAESRRSGQPGVPPGVQPGVPAGATATPLPRASAEDDNVTIGELVGELTQDLSRLMRQELELAKAELRQEASKAGKATGMLAAAGFAGYMTAVLLSLAAVFGLAHLMGLGWAALVVAVLWGIAGAVLFTTGRTRLRKVSPKPERTIETLKEDAEWLRHPTK
ncbi:phage holin family protein [Actinosynnema sp. CS-041913]|uniref:phage holin family protein n=1 Tax=Actinosynnema sp. CS-041913 TaxID=3239917 RepID=UPI003D8E8C11